jgi:8-oxo-dGTP pyrophosphatase MutT (NUDIX family)
MIDLQLTEALRAHLAGPLPGLNAQARMAPMARVEEMKGRRIPENAKKSAVLILFYPGENGIQFPLIRRNDYKGVHSGQISLPGGTWEESDGDLLYTALREANEEVGVMSEDVEILGPLTNLYIPPSNFMVQPYVGISHRRPDFVPDPAEVAQIIEAPLNHFRDSRYAVQSKIKHSTGALFDVPSFNILGHVVWGATAMMLSELTFILDEIEG